MVHRPGAARPARAALGATFALAVVWVTAARHEAAHALAAILGGRRVVEMRVWPGHRPDVGAYLGYVRYDGDPSPWILAAPYAVAAAWLAVTLLALRRVAPGTRARAALFGFGAVSALADLAYGYARFWRTGTDVARLLDTLPPPAVHAGFLATLAAALLAVRAERRRAARTGT